jgi:hypothetical protein
MTQPQDVAAAGTTRRYRRRLALFLVPLLGAAAVVSTLGVLSWRRGPEEEVASAPTPPTPTSAPPAPTPATHPPPKWSKFRPRAAVLRTAADGPLTGTDLDGPKGLVVPLTGWQEHPALDTWRGYAPIKGAACKYVHVAVRFSPPFTWQIAVGGSDSTRWPFVVGGEGRDGYHGRDGTIMGVGREGVPGPGGVWFGDRHHSLSAALIGITAGPRPTNRRKDKSPRVEVSLVE